MREIDVGTGKHLTGFWILRELTLRSESFARKSSSAVLEQTLPMGSLSFRAGSGMAGSEC